MHSRISEVLQANRGYQEALKTYADDIQAKLVEVDTLLVKHPHETAMKFVADLEQELAQGDEDEPEHDVDVGGYILAPGAVRPQSQLSPSDFSEEVASMCLLLA
jgi:hypothetical protein